MVQDKVLYEQRIRELQENVASLRMSRRILMTILEQVKNEQKAENKRLEDEKIRLKKVNNHYAEAIWEKNIRIRELEKRLEGLE